MLNILKQKNLSVWILLLVIIFSFLNVTLATSILEKKDVAVELKCENYICKCVRSENFNADTLEMQLKKYRVVDTALLACAYHQLGVISHYSNQYEKAILHYKEAIKLREQFNDGWLWKSQFNLAYSLFINNQYDKSLKYLKKSNIQPGYPKRPIDSITIFTTFAGVYNEIGDLENALEFAKKAFSINVEQKHIIRAKIIYADILISTKDTSNLKNGILLLKSLLSIDNHSTVKLVRINNILGNAYSYLNDFEKSTQYYSKALKLEENDATKAILASNMATIFTEQNNFELAVKYLNLSRKLNEEYFDQEYHYMYAGNYENFGDYYFKNKRSDSSLISYQKALVNLTDKFKEMDIHQNPNPKDSTLFIYSNPDIIRVLHLKASTAHQYYQQNKEEKYLTLANKTYQTAFNFHDKLQKEISTENSRLFQAKNIVPYIENALKVAYQQQENGQDISKTAFRFMEKNKATVLLQSMNEADALQFANLPDSLLMQEKDLKIAISFHTKQLNEALSDLSPSGGGSKGGGTEIKRLEKLLFEEKQQYSKLINNLENNYPNYYKLKYQQNLTQLADVQQSLDDQTALLEYFVGDSSIYILSIRKDQSKLYTIEKPNNWSQTVNNFLSTLNPVEVRKDEYTEELFKAFTQNAFALFQYLLEEPLADLNGTITNLQIIPDAELNYIPFDLLLTDSSSNKKVDYRTLPYLLKQKAISYAYSAALLLENKIESEAKTEYNYGGFAASYANNSPYQPLEATAENVQNIASLLNGKSNTGEEATKANFLQTQQQFSIIQLAMHGILDDENPLNSKLIFTQNKDTTNYALQAYELYNMKIPAQLAVLSACETGTGKQAKGEGIMSLSRAFTYAGCSSLVMSLWKIEDMATAQIVESFFENLKKGQAKHTALQQVKLNFLNTTSSERTHPIYWAGLVQSGSSEPIDLSSTNYLWFGLLLIPFFGLGIGYYLKS